jgi:hypothetical protein
MAPTMQHAPSAPSVPDPHAAVRPPQRGAISVDARRRFFARIVRDLRDQLEEPLAAFSHRGDFNLMKVWYANPRVHYEVVIDQQIDRIEVGLHFEDGPASTLAYLRLLDAHLLELKHELGWQVELERWTVSWGRLYELSELVPVTDAVAQATARRLAAFIRLLQPLVEAAAIAPERSAGL